MKRTGGGGSVATYSSRGATQDVAYAAADSRYVCEDQSSRVTAEICEIAGFVM